MNDINKKIHTHINRNSKQLCRVIHTARKSLKVSRRDMARHLGISDNVMLKYENGIDPIPRKVLLELLMYGMSRWARN